jgi:hypothetical protein
MSFYLQIPEENPFQKMHNIMLLLPFWQKRWGIKKFELFYFTSNFIKGALATILTKKMICFGNW